LDEVHKKMVYERCYKVHQKKLEIAVDAWVSKQLP